MKVELSKDQEKALRGIRAWHKKPLKQFITLGGYAGTGKTTLIAILRKSFKKKLRVAFATFTGKASRVLRGKLVEQRAICENDSVGTIHSLIYSPIVGEKDEIVGWERKKKIEVDLIIIDEASMVDGIIWSDLLGYGIPIVAVGDHGQLPPIRGLYNLMERPDLTLERIHRQARGNPIVEVSVWARKLGKIPMGVFGDGIRKIDRQEDGQEVEEILRNCNQDWLVLCGFNKSRIRLNQFIRSANEQNSDEPIKGDRVICLRNNHAKEVCNGMLGTIVSIGEKNRKWYKSEIEMDGEEKNYKGAILKEQFGQERTISYTGERYKTLGGDLFDWGYALTVHKAQGSQSPKVLLFEERFGMMNDLEWCRWLYTGVTRAEKELVVVGNR